MKLEEILDEWDKDSKIDRTELGDESLKLSRLTARWLRRNAEEKLLLRKFEEEFKALTLEKHEFYTQGPTKETVAKGWKTPAKGMILKGDIPTYMDADPDLSSLTLKIAYQKEKVDSIKIIMDTIGNMRWTIRNAIEDLKFKNGA